MVFEYKRKHWGFNNVLRGKTYKLIESRFSSRHSAHYAVIQLSALYLWSLETGVERIGEFNWRQGASNIGRAVLLEYGCSTNGVELRRSKQLVALVLGNRRGERRLEQNGCSCFTDERRFKSPRCLLGNKIWYY